MNINNIISELNKISNNENLLLKGSLCIRNNFSTDIFHSIEEWNNFDLWKRLFPLEHIKNIFFFAENILSYQYGIFDKNIVILNPEDSSLEIFASSISEWFSIVNSDPVTYLYSDILEEWKNKKGEVLLGEKLIPSLPFILGGNYNLDNFVKRTEIEAMDYYSQYARKLYKLQDGDCVKLKIKD